MTPQLRRSIRRTTGTALVAVVLAALAGCGDDDDQLGSTEGADTTVAERSTDTVADPPSGTADRAPEAVAGADAVLVELADLPPGWAEVPAEAMESDTGGACINTLVSEDGPFDASDDRRSSRAFSQSSLGAFLITAGARPVDDSAATVSEVEEVVAGCDGETDAAGFTTSIEAAPAPDGVDGAVAFRATASDERGAELSYLVAAAPAGDAAVLAVYAVALGDLDPGLVEDVLATMVARAE